MKKHVSLLRLIEWVAIRFLHDSNSQSVSVTVSRSVSQSINVTVTCSVNQSVWVSQSVNQCDSQSVRQPASVAVSRPDLQKNSQIFCKGNKFLRKLWCCVGGGLLKDNFWINWVDNVNWPSMWRVSKADISSVSYSSERIQELWVVHACLYAGNEARLLVQDLDCLSVRVSLSINSFCTLTICMTFSAAPITCGSLWSLSFGNDKKKDASKILPTNFWYKLHARSCFVQL